MRKQELVHLHALGAELRRHVATPPDGSADRFDAYDEQSVSPTSIHRRKDAHREAILHLYAGVAAASRTLEPDATPKPDSALSGDTEA